ncbi:RHS repeat-associated core domain-containing protein [Mitsuaria sp. GD03876]|uniref:RHS repeat-associated core domain-containing protein n=1 Tax=Mitsuaria sp. GD03876 TaxID=2975399 RepID=UPI002447289A|nr:RHS repeat-associated core domain-containing protein [Mitsuaria sp. GD03876]MDH0863814.1 type IV secretion protein Rhs [Mitsuaria sp. GD03876]
MKHSIDRREQRRGGVASAKDSIISITAVTAVGVSALLAAMTAHAALPPPPVSPAPVTDYEYDAKGNPTKVIKAKGVSGFGFSTTNAYDALDRVKTNTDARNGVTALGYDGLDQLKQVTDPRSLVTSYQRNGLGDLTQLVSPDTGTANSTFDPNGNLLTRTDSRGVLGTYVYDDLNRMTSATYTLGGQSLPYTWTYDQTGGDFGYGIGRLTTATGSAGNTKYGYDGNGRVVAVIQTVGTATFTTRYGYDRADHITSITYPSGRVLTITYAEGYPTAMSIAKDAASPAQPLISGIQWEPFGGVRSWLMHMASGTKLQERVYDQYGRLVRYPLLGVVRDITYDAADRIVSYTHLDAATGQSTAAAQAMNQSFSYDEMGRLIGIVAPSASWTIGYDANGNRAGVTLNGTARSYSTSATSNRLDSISNPTRSFGYDATGNTLSDTGLAYTTTYRLDNRMGSLTKGAVTWYYSYDAGGQRIRKNGSQTTHFVYDQGGQLLGEYGATAPNQEFVWLGGLPVAVLNGAAADPQVLHVYADHLGAPRMLVDKNSALRWRWISEPFGSTAAEENPSGLGAIAFNLRFPGQFADKESGLNYNYFRDYDGTTGRYVQSDPIGLHGGINSYAYVQGDPLSFIDPQGDVRQGGKTGKWWEFNDRNFQRWFHQCIKQPGDQDATREELADAHAEWISYGKPDGKNGCGGPPPPPAPASAPASASASASACGEECQKTAKVVVVAGTAYVVYRCIRMVPSLFPPLWPTIPANVAIP